MENLTIENLSKEELIVYQQLFSIYDKQDIGIIETLYFPAFLRGLGHCPTQKQLQEIRKVIDPHNKGIVYFNDLINIVIKRKKQQNIEQQLMQAFEGLNSDASSHSDGEKSYKMSATGAKKYLTQFGQKFSDKQVEQFLQFLEANNLKIGHEFNYQDLAKILAYSYVS